MDNINIFKIKNYQFIYKLKLTIILRQWKLLLIMKLNVNL